MPRVRPVSLQLPNGRLALLSPTFMTAYFRARLRRWYPGTTLRALAIKDTSATLFKKSIVYTLTLAAGRTTRDVRLRANVPSLDTTHEARNAYAALHAIEGWNERHRSSALPVSRPLAFDLRLRAFFYEEVAGAPLLPLLRRPSPALTPLLRASGAWLRQLHAAALPAGPVRTHTLERREAYFFTLNYGHYYPPCHDQARALLDRYLAERKRTHRALARHFVLSHGDYTPANIIIRPKKSGIAVIDFGNVRRFDPYFDAANTVVQLQLTAWLFDHPLARYRALAADFLRSYAPHKATKAEERRYRMGIAWWSLQTLSYTFDTFHSPTKHKAPLIRASLARAEAALAGKSMDVPTLRT